MSKSPSSISDLIGRFSTIAEFAAAVGCGYEAARQMNRRESIDPKHWSKVVDAAAKRSIAGVTYEWLAAQRTSPQERAS